MAAILSIFSSSARAADDLLYHLRVGDDIAYSFALLVEDGSHRIDFTGSNRLRVDPLPPASKELEGAANQGTGTGFVVAADGYLVTCAHVIKDAAKIEVALNEKTYEARVVGQDKTHDVAVIKIEATGLPVLPLADSEAVELAQEVRAVGYPLSDVLGESIKITRGTIAGIIKRPDGKILQVDAGINPGNSGGPLINDHGQVVGVVSAKLLGDIVTSVGFVQPINDAKKLLQGKATVEEKATDGDKLEGPALAKRVIPSVGLITVTQRPVLESLRMVSFASNVNVTSAGGSVAPINHSGTDQGHLLMNTQGEVYVGDFKANLFCFGPLGQIGLEQLPEGNQKSWKVERVVEIALAKSAPQGQAIPTAPLETPGNGGAGRSRFNRLPGGFGNHAHGRPGQPGQPPQGPAAPPQAAQQVTVAVATMERTSYQIMAATPAVLNVKKTVELTSLPGARTKLSMTGTGMLEIDPRTGIPENLTFDGTVTVSGDSAKVNWTYRRIDPAHVKTALPPVPAYAGGQPGGKRTPPVPGLASSGPPALGADEPRVRERVDVPSEVSLSKAQKLVDELFASDFSAADKPQEKLALANKLVEHARQQKTGHADQYALLDKARDLAAAGGDWKLSRDIVAEIDKSYRANVAALKHSSLEILAASASTAEQQRKIAEGALTTIDDAVRSDQFDLARQLGKLAVTAGRKTKDERLIKRVNERAASFKQLAQEFAAYQEAVAKLKDAPQDAVANMVVGKYDCFVRGDWARGLPLLALAEDTTLRTLAGSELADPSVGDAQLEVAEGWWDLGESLPEMQKANLRRHALVWYQKAVNVVGGLSKIKCEKRLASAAAADSPLEVALVDEDGKPLSARDQLIKRVEAAVGGGRTTATEEGGFTLGNNFVNVPEPGGLLVGFDVAYNGRNIAAIRPIYQTSKGQQAGPPFGVTVAGTKNRGMAAVTKHIVAKKGYAVGGISVKGVLNLSAMNIIFMEIGPKGLNAATTYESGWIGPQGKLDPQKDLGGDGAPVIGIFGHGNGNTVCGLGLVLGNK